jgi:hypothetical protein
MRRPKRRFHFLFLTVYFVPITFYARILSIYFRRYRVYLITPLICSVERNTCHMCVCVFMCVLNTPVLCEIDSLEETTTQFVINDILVEWLTCLFRVHESWFLFLDRKLTALPAFSRFFTVPAGKVWDNILEYTGADFVHTFFDSPFRVVQFRERH